MDECRNCGAQNLTNLGFIGTLAPFFLKRVFNAELIIRKSKQTHKRLLQRLTRFAHRVVSRIQPVAVAVELQSCPTCSFVQTVVPFNDHAIGRLYADYRSASYNLERTQYEPAYSGMVDRLGHHKEAGLGRIEALTLWLRSKADLDCVSMLDFGGADGQFLPNLPGPKFVYEISDIKPAPGVTRLSDPSSLQTYGYVQLAHVLEHVTHPLQMVRQVAALVKLGGFLLIEVPQDMEDAGLAELQRGHIESSIGIHEHINYYSVLAVRKLFEAVGLDVVLIDPIVVESPIARQTYIRGLARRP